MKINYVNDPRHVGVGMTYLSPERGKNFIRLAESASLLDGSMAELGVAHGGIVIGLAEGFPSKVVYAFDTFEGFKVLPESYFEASPRFSDSKEYYRKDGYKEWSRTWGRGIEQDKVLEAIGAYSNIIVRKGLFPDTVVGLEGERYCLVHIDVDIYSSTYYGLEYFWPRMVTGGVIILDDFFFEKPRYPQLREAVEEYFKKSSEEVVTVEVSGQGVIVKK